MKKLLFAVSVLMLIFIGCSYTDFKPVSVHDESVTKTETSHGFIYEKNGFSCEYNTNTKTLTLNGKGISPFHIDYDDYPELKAINIGDEISEIQFYFDDISPFPETIIIGKACKSIHSSYDVPACVVKEYIVDSQNPHFASYKGALYTKNFKKLISLPKKFDYKDFHPKLEVLGKYSYQVCEPMISIVEDEGIWTFDYHVIPWGVTTIEGVLSGNGMGMDPDSFIVPNTLVNLIDLEGLGHYYYYTDFLEDVLIKKYGNGPADEPPHFGSRVYDSSIYSGPLRGSDIYDYQFYDVYGVKPNSLKTFANGKTYFFGPSYEYAKGWKKVNGTWYYFNDYGAAVVKIWLKSGGKWYYMKEDGTMATNKWIKWYNKWYYVGKDGAMYANRKTPDGYYVNASGVWVK